MAQYRVLCADLVGNAIREELPIQDLEYSFILDAAGSFSGWISLDDPKCTRSNLDPGATAIYIERGGQLVWGGILWSAQVDTEDRKLQLGGEGFWSYFSHRTIKNRTAMTSATAASKFTHLPDTDFSSSNVIGVPNSTDLFANLANPSTSDYVVSLFAGGVSGYQASFNIPSGTYTGLSIQSVRLNILTSSVGGETVFPLLNIGGGTFFGQPVIPTGTTSTISYTWTKNPATGVAWTVADAELFGSSSYGGWATSNGVSSGDTKMYYMYLEISWGTTGTAVFIGADQLAIARDIINNAQAQPGGDIGIVVGTELTTDNDGAFVGRDMTYYVYERKNTATSVEDLAKLVNGFDFSIEVQWDSGGTIPQRFLRLYYPKRGRRIDGLVFNDNILGVSKVGVDVDASVMANSVALMGNGDGDNMLISTTTDTSLLSRYPLLEAVYSAKDVTSQTTLNQQAVAVLARNKYPLENPSIEKQANTWPDFGSFQLGDEALVVTRDGWINIDSYQQVQQITITVGNEGQEIMTPVFVSADGTVA